MGSVVVRGCMGVGKSTFCAELAKYLEYPHYKELAVGNKLLELSYQDRRFCLAAQVEILMQQYGQLFHGTGVFETSIEEVLYVYGQHRLDSEEYNLLRKLYFAIQYLIPIMDIEIYLYARPDVIFRRIQNRSRGMEEYVELRTIESLCSKFDDMWIQLQGKSSKTKFIKIDYNDFLEDRQKQEIFEKINLILN